MRTLLFVGGSEETLPALLHAIRLGYRVFVTDQDHRSPCIERADDWASASTYDKKSTLEAAKGLNELHEIAGVVAVGCDVGPTVSYVAKGLCLPHIPHVITRLSHDKVLLKSWLYPGSIPVPTVADDEDTKWIIKPVDSRGGRGVYCISRNGAKGEDIEELKSASLRYSQSKNITMERFIPGPQISAETIVWGGQDVFTGFTDRNYDQRFLPHMIENGGEGPSVFEETEHAIVLRAVVQRVIEHLGIESGTFKSDFVLDIEENYKPVLIEAAFGRMSGGYSCSHHLPIAYGIDFLGAAFAVACGDDPRPVLKKRKATRFTCGRYELGENVTDATGRGRFFFGAGKTREEALEIVERNMVSLREMESTL